MKTLKKKAPKFTEKKCSCLNNVPCLDPIEFKVGDIVEAFGLRGRVFRITLNTLCPIEVIYDIPTSEGGDLKDDFTKDGLYNPYHKTPSLKLISRPKTKENKTIYRWVNLYADGRVSIVSYLTPEQARAVGGNLAVRQIELKGEYEVEEE